MILSNERQTDKCEVKLCNSDGMCYPLNWPCVIPVSGVSGPDPDFHFVLPAGRGPEILGTKNDLSHGGSVVLILPSWPHPNLFIDEVLIWLEYGPRARCQLPNLVFVWSWNNFRTTVLGPGPGNCLGPYSHMVELSPSRCDVVFEF